jgi:hypothetical protein
MGILRWGACDVRGTLCHICGTRFLQEVVVFRVKQVSPCSEVEELAQRLVAVAKGARLSDVKAIVAEAQIWFSQNPPSWQDLTRWLGALRNAVNSCRHDATDRTMRALLQSELEAGKALFRSGEVRPAEDDDPIPIIIGGYWRHGTRTCSSQHVTL